MKAKVLDTLLMLVKNNERPVSKEELIHAVWPNTFVSDDSLVQNISAIRRGLGDDPSQPQYVVTLARRGYRFVAPVDAYSGDVAAIAPTSGPPHSERPILRLPAGAASRSQVWWVGSAAFTAGATLAVLIILAMLPARTQSVSSTAVRFREALPADQVLEGGAALSPDGRFLVFALSDSSGKRRLWIRSLKEGDLARPLEGTADALAPFWSPDSQDIGYFVGQHIRRIAVSGGTPRPVVTLQRSLPLGGTWSGDQILYVDQGKIFSVAASGGTPVVAAEPSHTSAGELRWPYFLPDGQHFLFVVNSDYPDRSGTYRGRLGSSESVKVSNDADAPVIYAAPGYLLRVRDGALVAQPFDPPSGTLRGEPKAVVGDMTAGMEVSATNGGLLAVSEHTFGGNAIWFDRSGRELGRFKVPKVLRNMSISADDKHVLATSSDGGSLTIWKLDLERNVSTKFVGNAGFTAWAPDGDHFAYSSVGTGGAADLVVRSTAGSEQSVLLKTDDMKVVNDWSPDGRYVLFTNRNDQQSGLWVLPTVGDRQAQRLGQGHTSSGKFSPDGRLIAYVSDETGSPEVFIASFPAFGAMQQVSTAGGTAPVWRKDGRELYYLSGDWHVMSIAVPPNGLNVGKPQALFALPDGTSFEATRDGARFLTVVRDRSGNQGAVTVLTNWLATAR
jgi:Tol biopolymer transport system component